MNTKDTPVTKAFCPYTWVMNVLGIQKTKAPEPKHVEPQPYHIMYHGAGAMRSLERLGEHMMRPSIKSHTGNAGNVPIRSEDSFSIPQQVSHIEHVGLRSFVGRVGSMMDVSRLSFETQYTIDEFETSIMGYRSSVEPLLCLANENNVYYKDLGDLITFLDQELLEPSVVEQYIEMKNELKLSIGTSQAKFDKLRFQLQSEPCFYQINSDSSIPNQPYHFEGMLYPAEVLYCAKKAAKAIIDTTKNPPHVMAGIQKTLGATTMIISNISTMVDSWPKPTREPVYELARETCETMQKRIVRLGSYEEVMREIGGGKLMITHLGLDDPAVFAYIKQQAGDGRSIAPKKTGGKCPFRPTGT